MKANTWELLVQWIEKPLWFQSQHSKFSPCGKASPIFACRQCMPCRHLGQTNTSVFSSSAGWASFSGLTSTKSIAMCLRNSKVLHHVAQLFLIELRATSVGCKNSTPYHFHVVTVGKNYLLFFIEYVHVCTPKSNPEAHILQSGEKTSIDNQTYVQYHTVLLSFNKSNNIPLYWKENKFRASCWTSSCCHDQGAQPKRKTHRPTPGRPQVKLIMIWKRKSTDKKIWQKHMKSIKQILTNVNMLCVNHIYSLGLDPCFFRPYLPWHIAIAAPRRLVGHEEFPNGGGHDTQLGATWSGRNCGAAKYWILIHFCAVIQWISDGFIMVFKLFFF